MRSELGFTTGQHNLHEKGKLGGTLPFGYPLSRKETNESADGTVIEQIRMGYQLNDRLVRPASVIVATPPISESETKENKEE